MKSGGSPGGGSFWGHRKRFWVRERAEGEGDVRMGEGSGKLREVTGQQGSWMSLEKNLVGLTQGFKEGSL